MGIRELPTKIWVQAPSPHDLPSGIRRAELSLQILPGSSVRGPLSLPKPQFLCVSSGGLGQCPMCPQAECTPVTLAEARLALALI